MFNCMDWLNIILVSLSMSVDAMTVNATNGLKYKNISNLKIIICALVFGIFQFGMPVIGYFIGFKFKDTLSLYIPWIAFGLLFLLGGKSLYEWGKEFTSKEEVNNESKTLSIFNILVQGVATSIDALCIGFIYINLSIPNALIVFSIIGVTTFILSTLTGIFGKSVGKYLTKWAELIAGLVFIIIGIKILVEGLL